MFHSGTQTLIDHWTALPDSARIPARAAFDPMRLAALTPQMFMIERAGARVRLAGGWVERAHGQALRGTDWLTLWRHGAQTMVATAMTQAFREARPVVLTAEAPGLLSVLEIIVTPLRGPSGEADRLLGLYQPTKLADGDARDIGPLNARFATGAGPVTRAPLTLAAIDGRRIA